VVDERHWLQINIRLPFDCKWHSNRDRTVSNRNRIVIVTSV